MGRLRPSPVITVTMAEYGHGQGMVSNGSQFLEHQHITELSSTKLTSCKAGHPNHILIVAAGCIHFRFWLWPKWAM